MAFAASAFACAPPSATDTPRDGGLDLGDGDMSAPAEDTATASEALAGSWPARTCTTATRIASTGSEWRYETLPFTSLDEHVIVRVTEVTTTGARRSWGTLRLDASVREGVRWDEPRGRMTVRLARVSGRLSIGVSHHSTGVTARAANGYCTTTHPGASCGAGQRFGCAEGACACRPLSEIEPVLHPAGAFVVGMVATGGAASLADGPIPLGDLVGVALVVVAGVTFVVAVPPDEWSSQRAAIVRALSETFGSVLAIATDDADDRSTECRAPAAGSGSPGTEREREMARLLSRHINLSENAGNFILARCTEAQWNNVVTSMSTRDPFTHRQVRTTDTRAAYEEAQRQLADADACGEAQAVVVKGLERLTGDDVARVANELNMQRPFWARGAGSIVILVSDALMTALARNPHFHSQATRLSCR